jgi:hypothetical protein
MKTFSLWVLDPPRELETGEACKPGAVMRAPPIAAAFTYAGRPTEICRLYGYLMLLGQNLEFELRECLMNMRFAFAFRGVKPRFTGNPEKAKFEKLIQMFASQLNVEHPPTKEFVGELDRARKLRNRLAHGFFSPSELTYYVTPGGQRAVLHRLKLAEKIFFPLVMLIGHLGRAYAADYGVTDEFVERRRRALEAERRQIENDLRDIFDESESDGGVG